MLLVRLCGHETAARSLVIADALPLQSSRTT